MADSDDEDELLVTFAVTSVAAAVATFMLDAVLDMSRCCGFVVGDRFVVDLLSMPIT